MNVAKIGAANNSANNNANSNASVAQSAVAKTDTVELSQKSEALAAATATKSEPKAEEATKQVTAKEKSKDARENNLQAMRKGQRELKGLVKDLKEAGVGRREIGKVVRTANRQANKTIGREIGQAYKDFSGKKISRSEFENKLYGSAVKKLDSIVSALKGLRDQKIASVEAETKSTTAVEQVVGNGSEDKETSTSVVKTNEDNAEKVVTKFDDDDDKKETEKAAKNGNGPAATPPGLAKKEELPPGLAKKEVTTTAETTTSELILKEEKVVAKTEEEAASTTVVSKTVILETKDSGIISLDGNGSPDKMFAEIVNFFNDIDKMVNGFAGKVEGNDSDDEDNGQGLKKFASKLNKMFSGINKTFAHQSNRGNIANKLGMAYVNKGEIRQLFGGDGATNGSGKINSIGKDSETNHSSSFNAVRFMSSLSGGMNSALDKYKEVQDIMAKRTGSEADNSTIA